MIHSSAKTSGHRSDDLVRWTMFATPLGEMLLAATDKGICRLSFEGREEALHRAFPGARIVEDRAGLGDMVRDVLTAIERPDQAKPLPIDLRGTDFQRRVWQELCRIPLGETRSYAQIAAAIGQPGAIRAVGTANGANPVAVLVPCHRVIRSDGTLGGYGGGLPNKTRLLAAEGVVLGSPELPLVE